jgi:hypothetical protein
MSQHLNFDFYFKTAVQTALISTRWLALFLLQTPNVTGFNGSFYSGSYVANAARSHCVQTLASKKGKKNQESVVGRVFISLLRLELTTLKYQIF